MVSAALCLGIQHAEQGTRHSHHQKVRAAIHVLSCVPMTIEIKLKLNSDECKAQDQHCVPTRTYSIELLVDPPTSRLRRSASLS